MLLPETDRSGARIKAERLREAIEHYPFPGAERLAQGHLTASIGVASYPLDAETGEELLARADEALLSAKRAGRNQVRIPSDQRSSPSGAPAVREVGSYRRLLPVLGGRLRSEGALAALSVTLTQLAKVEAEYGAHLSRQLLSQLEEAVLRAVGLFGETPVLGTCEDEARLSLLIFLPGRRTSRCPATADLAALAERLEASLSHQLFRLEKLVHAPGRVVVGWGEGVYSSRLPVERLVAEVVTEAGESVERRLEQLQSQDRTLLRQLLVEEELSFRYQPIVRNDGTRFGVEALVRGPPDRGWDRPDHLFWRAAEVGLLDELDRGCALGALRGAAGRLDAHEKLFINVLPSSLYDDSFVESELPQAVSAAGLTPDRIVLEVTEQHAIEKSRRLPGVDSSRGKHRLSSGPRRRRHRKLQSSRPAGDPSGLREARPVAHRRRGGESPQAAAGGRSARCRQGHARRADRRRHRTSGRSRRAPPPGHRLLPGLPLRPTRAVSWPLTPPTLAWPTSNNSSSSIAPARFYARCGLKLLSHGNGQAEMECPVAGLTLNVNGDLHGGLIALLVDEAGTVALADADREGRPGVTTDLTVSYVSPGRPPRVIAKARTLKVGRTLGFVHVDVVGDDGKLVASGRMTKFMDTPKR